MRFLTYASRQGPRLGVLVGELVYDVPGLYRRLFRAQGKTADGAAPQDLQGLIERSSIVLVRRLLALARSLPAAGRRTLTRPLRDVTLLAPIPRPRKNIFCVGRNYAEHARERGVAPPEHPVWFTKPPTAVIAPFAPVVSHPGTTALDYEAELVVVIGRRGRDIARGQALDYVFGYTVMNDVTARDLQHERGQWFKGKSLDSFAPMGPWVVHRSALPDPQHLAVRSRVNGEPRQDASTADMIFSVAVLIADLSRGMTLEPGDLIATGTPGGVGSGFQPPRYLAVGDVAEVEVEGIGTLRNPVVAARR